MTADRSGRFAMVVVLAAVLGARPSPGADRFVSVDGDDQGYTNDCLDSTAPCRTLHNATIFQSQDGDVVKVARGRYDGLDTGDTSVAATISGGWDPDFGGRNPDRALTTMGSVYTQSYSANAALIALSFDGITLYHITHFGSIGTATFALNNCRLKHGLNVGVVGNTVLDIHLVDTTASGRARYGGGALNLSVENGAVGTFTMEDSAVEKTAGLEGTGIVGTVYPGGSLTMNIERSRLYRNAKYGVVVDGATLNIVDSIIERNRYGGIQLTNGAVVTVANTIIARNRAFDHAGAIHQFGGTLNVVNATIRKNRSACRLAPCSGAVVVAGGSAALTNSIMFENLTPNGEADDLVIQSGTVTIDHSVLGEVSGAYSDGGGNLATDPLCAARDDHHLTAASPAIDAGTCAGAPTDFEGDARPTGSGCDIGADEFAP